MLLKICYKPNGFYYVKDVTEIDFSSNVDTDVSVDYENKHLYHGDTPMNGNIFTCLEYIEKGLGVAPHEEDGRWYINNVSFHTPAGEQFIAFTGHAYICDDSGKTIDVLR